MIGHGGLPFVVSGMLSPDHFIRIASVRTETI